MSNSKRYMVTSALPYANGPLHIGHLAGAYLPADIFVRYLRLMGKDVVFACGSDEHGAAITIRAKKEGLKPKDIIDKYHALNQNSFKELGISFDIFHRTSDPLHYETAQEFFLKLYKDGGQFDEEVSEQFYDVKFDQFLADRYIIGECPNCQNPDAYGDQCENCGSTLSPLELVNPKSTLSGEHPERRATKHWYFRLDKHSDWLREWVKTGQVENEQHHDPKIWKKHVVGQCLSWLDNKEGLRPRSITRDLSWGIPVPLEGAEGKVLYVWFDAPIGYISATKQWAKDNGKNWEDYWKSDDAELVHFIGKDNIVFHCIVFPAMLKAHGDYNLPVNVPANQFLNFEGQKFSKSKGWGIMQHTYLEEFKDFPNHKDALRYALIRNMPENRDSDFKWDDFVDFHDKELADNLGNFVNRVLVLTNKYYEGVVPEIANPNNDILKKAKGLVDQIGQDIEGYQFKPAIQHFMELSGYGNTYLQDESPWKIWKTEPESEAVKDCIYNCLQIVGYLSVVASPFIPFTADKLRGMLNLPAIGNGALADLHEMLNNGKAILSSGHKIGESEILFAKIHDRKDKSRLEIVERQKSGLAAIAAAEASTSHEPLKDEITFDDFTKLDIRTATILEAEKVPKADKLLKIKLDLGFEQRIVVSGIAKYYDPEKIIGKQVLVLANLAPRKLRGVMSQGMILMAENEEGALSFVSPEEGWGNGFSVR